MPNNTVKLRSSRRRLIFYYSRSSTNAQYANNYHSSSVPNLGVVRGGSMNANRRRLDKKYAPMTCIIIYKS